MLKLEILQGIMIPFLGTALGAAMVFIFKENMHMQLEKVLQGFAAGIMVSASFFSLILPGIEQTETMGTTAFFAVPVGFLFGIFFLLFLDDVVPHLHLYSEQAEGLHSSFKKTTMLVLAVTLHNIPEGMAVGVVYAGWLTGNEKISLTSALALALGIAIQNFPEGAIISMPLHAEGESKIQAFLQGMLSGVVEPIGALIMILAAGKIVWMMPALLGFAAGAMIYVVVEELIPEMSAGEHSNRGTVAFAIGFVIMMILDVLLG